MDKHPFDSRVDSNQTDGSSSIIKPPTLLAVVNINGDYLDVCMDLCCTGSKHPCKLPVGTVALVRRTSGGSAKKLYGVQGIWYYTGRSVRAHRRALGWPIRWGWKVEFKPLVHRFKTPFCEDFSVPLPAGKGPKGHRASKHIPGLVYTMLQGTILKLPAPLALGYLKVLLDVKSQELAGEAEYLGRKVPVRSLLEQLAQGLQ